MNEILHYRTPPLSPHTHGGKSPRICRKDNRYLKSSKAGSISCEKRRTLVHTLAHSRLHSLTYPPIHFPPFAFTIPRGVAPPRTFLALTRWSFLCHAGKKLAAEFFVKEGRSTTTLGYSSIAVSQSVSQSLSIYFIGEKAVFSSPHQ